MYRSRNILMACFTSWLLLISSWANGHALAPSLLSVTLLTEMQGSVLWKESSNRTQGENLAPVFPSNCTRVADPDVSTEGKAVLYRWQFLCDTSLMGERISIQGLETSNLSVFVEVSGPTEEYTSKLLGRDQPSFVVPKTYSWWREATHYVSSGIQHLWAGWDHLLFVFALFILLRKSPKVLLGAVTAFTLGHSLTLAAVSLGWMVVSSVWVEQGIALSILFMAVELLNPNKQWLGMSIKRYPYLLTVSFGLLHGLGFASVLNEMLSSNHTKLLPLISFNIGIEIGQCILLLLLAGLMVVSQKIPQQIVDKRFLLWRRVLIGYGIGMMSMYWLIIRGLG